MLRQTQAVNPSDVPFASKPDVALFDHLVGELVCYQTSYKDRQRTGLIPSQSAAFDSQLFSCSVMYIE